ncbi:MAG: hypothetical protein ISS31_09075 [Kiritimatiellae bacterium]|nr:hypothetical protein [Kiritimatiellia bacterium]
MSDPAELEELGEEIGGGHATVTLRNGVSLRVRDIEFGADTCSWFDVEGAERRSVPTAMLGSVRTRSHLLGGGRGFLVGAAAGLLFAGVSYSSSEPYSDIGFIVLPPLTGIIGFLAGLLTGADGPLYEIDLQGDVPDTSGVHEQRAPPN